MRHHARWTTLALALLSAAAFLNSSLRAEDVKVEGDLKKLQGTWVNESTDGPDATWVIEGDKLTATVDGGEYKCQIKLDAKAEPNKTVDIEIKEAPGDAAGAISKAIYKFEGERLLLCVAFPGRTDRPTEYKSTPEECHFFELKKK